MSTSFALIGQAGDGKTTLADSLLMAAGVTNRLGSVEDGSSYMNWLPEEKTRRLTISASVCSFAREGQLVTAIDSPGDTNFAGEAIAALNAVDNAVLVVSARDGVRIGTERSYRLARERGIAVTAVANKLDLELADYDACATQLEESLEVRVVKLHLPVGAGEDFSGYVDLLSGDLHRYATDGSGKVEVSAPPADLSEEVETRHMELVEAAAEADDTVLEKYLEEGEVSDEEVVATLRKGLREGSLLPLLSACASRNIGGAALLEASERFFPAASDVAPIRGARGDEELELSPDPNGPLAALVFKSVADRYTGVLSVLRVFSGKLSVDSAVSNARTGTRERVTKLLRVNGEHTEEVSEVGPGEIAALPKLKDTKTGDTLCAEKDSLSVTGAPPPAGVISFAVQATAKGEEDKVFESLNRLVEEDPSLQLGRDERDRGVSAHGPGPAPHRGDAGEAQAALRCRCDSQAPKGSLPGDDQRPRRQRRGKAQEAVRGTRAVRSLLSLGRARRARLRSRLSGRDRWRLDSSPVHSCRRKGRSGSVRARDLRRLPADRYRHPLHRRQASQRRQLGDGV